MSKSLKKVQFEMWFTGDKTLINVEFIYNNILVEGKSISILIKNCQIMFSGLPYFPTFNS